MKQIKKILNFINKNKSNFKFITTFKRIILMAILLIAINNYYFYRHVEQTTKRNANQLNLMLNSEIQFCRNNRISIKRYKQHIVNLVNDFVKKHYYIDTFILKDEKNNILYKIKEHNWDKIVASNIFIILPKLKNKDKLYFSNESKFNTKEYASSVLRSMTYSILPNPFYWWSNLDKLWDNVYWYRTRPALFFIIISLILMLWLRTKEIISEEKMEKIKVKAKEQRKKDEFFKTLGIKEENEDIELYKSIMNNDISKLKKIKFINPTMTIIKFNALIDHTEDKKLERLKILVDKGINIQFIDKEGMTSLMYYALGNKNNDKNSRIIKMLIQNGVDIDAQNKSGMTALMLCSLKNKPASVQILIDNGANTTIRQDLTAKELAATEEIKEIISNAISHDPKELVKILSNFTNDTPLKCTTHAWEGSCESCKEMSFDDFIYKVQTQWNLIKKDIKKLSLNLHNKIEAFIFNRVPKEWCKDTGLNVGWSNLDGLKEHCDGGGKPFEFVLKKPINLKNETLTAFKEVVKRFKEKIEVRNDSDMLKSIFVDFEEKLNNNEITCDICPSIDGIDFYTDVEKFKSTLNLILNGIVAKKNNSDKVEIKLKKPNPESVEIHIIHKNSFSNRTKEEMLAQADDGDFKGIKENLTNLCDWSVEDVFEDKSYRVNYLKSNNTKDTQDLDKKTIGFTHILRFYQ